MAKKRLNPTIEISPSAWSELISRTGPLTGFWYIEVGEHERYTPGLPITFEVGKYPGDFQFIVAWAGKIGPRNILIIERYDPERNCSARVLNMIQMAEHEMNTTHTVHLAMKERKPYFRIEDYEGKCDHVLINPELLPVGMPWGFNIAYEIPEWVTTSLGTENRFIFIDRERPLMVSGRTTPREVMRYTGVIEFGGYVVNRWLSFSAIFDKGMLIAVSGGLEGEAPGLILNGSINKKP